MIKIEIVFIDKNHFVGYPESKFIELPTCPRIGECLVLYDPGDFEDYIYVADVTHYEYSPDGDNCHTRIYLCDEPNLK